MLVPLPSVLEQRDVGSTESGHEVIEGKPVIVRQVDVPAVVVIGQPLAASPTPKLFPFGRERLQFSGIDFSLVDHQQVLVKGVSVEVGQPAAVALELCRPLEDRDRNADEILARGHGIPVGARLFPLEVVSPRAEEGMEPALRGHDVVHLCSEERRSIKEQRMIDDAIDLLKCSIRSLLSTAALQSGQPVNIMSLSWFNCLALHVAAASTVRLMLMTTLKMTSTNPYAEGERMGQTGDPFKSRVITRGFGDNTDNDPMGKDYVGSPRSVRSFPGAGSSNILKYREKTFQ